MSGEIYEPAAETTAEHRALAWRLRYPDCKTWSDESAPGFAHAEVERIAVELAALVAAARAEGAAAEREACAQTVEDMTGTLLAHIAAAIRARSGDGDPLATVKADAAQAVVEAIRSAAPGPNAALSMPGGAGPFVDLRMKAYGEGWHDAFDVAALIAAEFRAGERS